MRSFWAIDRLRLYSTGFLAAVLVLLSGYAGQRAWTSRRAFVVENAVNIEGELAALMHLWGQQVEQSVMAWLSGLADEPAPGLAELRQRSKVPWFDAWMLLEPGPQGLVMRWPRPSQHEDAEAVLAEPCIGLAAQLQTAGAAVEAAQAYAACSPETDEALLYARIQAGRLYLSLGSPDVALAVLDDRRVPLRLPFVEGVHRGLDLRRLVQRMEVAALAEQALQDGEGRAEALTFLADQVLSLPAPQLKEALSVAERVIGRDLPEAATPERRAELARAQRRVAAVQVVADTMAAVAPTLSPDRLLLTHAEGPFPRWTLAWTALADGRVAVLLIDSEALLRPIMRTAREGPMGDYRLVDRDHRVIFGDGSVLDPRDHVEVPVGALFPQLHIAAGRSPQTRTDQVAEDLLSVLGPVVAALLLSGMALSMQLAADRRARELSERQDAFIARVTHELKTPLAGIRVMAETLELGAADDPATRSRFLGKILGECDNLGARIDEVLAAARRPELGGTRRLPLDDLARVVVGRWGPRFAAQNADLVADLRPTVAVDIDEPLMQDALGNLLDNALKYHKTGQRLRCEVRSYQHGAWAVVEVADNGIGVPAAMRRKIFERFVRVEGPGRGKSGGHGLGLAFVGEAIAAHSGLVECVEGIDGGARFRMKLRDPRARGFSGWVSRLRGAIPTPRT